MLNSLRLISSWRQKGAKPLIALYVNSNILKSIRNLTDSQCRLYNSGLTWQYLDSWKIILAAAFWTQVVFRVYISQDFARFCNETYGKVHNGNFHVPCHMFRCKVHGLAISFIARYMEISKYLARCFVARYMEISMYLAL